MKKIAVGLVCFIVLLVSLSVGFDARADFAFNSGTFTVTATEPTVNEDGTPLTDLDHTTLYYQIDDGEWVFITDIPASSPNGGGNISHTLTIDVPVGSEVSVRAVGTSSDQVGNTSEAAYSDTIRIDKLSPGSPQI